MKIHTKEFRVKPGDKIKLFLHLSKDEQKNRFLARLDDPDKNWKRSASSSDKNRRIAA